MSGKEIIDIMKIGKRIKDVFDQMPKSCNVNWFAKRLHCDRRNIYRIFEKDNIDIHQLSQISSILNHDFFKDLSEIWSEKQNASVHDSEL